MLALPLAEGGMSDGLTDPPVGQGCALQITLILCGPMKYVVLSSNSDESPSMLLRNGCKQAKRTPITAYATASRQHNIISNDSTNTRIYTKILKYIQINVKIIYVPMTSLI